MNPSTWQTFDVESFTPFLNITLHSQKKLHGTYTCKL
jgi:hypothetical protein